MKKLLKIMVVLLFGTALASCNYDADAELKALEEEMDRLEQEDQRIRDHFLEKINSLRGRLTDLIAQVEQELGDKIDNGGKAVLRKLNQRVSELTTRINNGFDDARDYMDETFTSCRNYITKSFQSLEDSQAVLASEIEQARQKGEDEQLAVLLLLEKDLDKVSSGAAGVQGAIDRMENQLSEAEAMKKRLDRVATTLDDLDEAYTEMEGVQLSLMQALEDYITDEYLESLTTTQLAQVKALVAEAEDLVDEMEGMKEDMKNLSQDTEEYLAGIENVASFLEDINSEYQGVVDDLSDGLSNIEEFWDYFENSEAESWYDEIDGLAEANIELYDETIGILEEQSDKIDAFYSESWDWYDTIHSLCDEVYSLAGEAKDKANEITNR